MSKIDASAVTYHQRERELNIAPLKPTRGIGEIHKDHQPNYKTYENARRTLMLKYIQATYARDGGTEARRLSGQIQALDAKYSQPKVVSTTTVTPLMQCEQRDVVVHDKVKRESRPGKQVRCRQVGELVETKTTGGGLKEPAITRGVRMNGQTQSIPN